MNMYLISALLVLLVVRQIRGHQPGRLCEVGSWVPG
jgi:hypothetical protein